MGQHKIMLAGKKRKGLNKQPVCFCTLPAVWSVLIACSICLKKGNTYGSLERGGGVGERGGHAGHTSAACFTAVFRLSGE